MFVSRSCHRRVDFVKKLINTFHNSYISGSLLCGQKAPMADARKNQSIRQTSRPGNQNTSHGDVPEESTSTYYKWRQKQK